MKAFVYRIDDQGRDMLGTSNGSFVTNNYRDMRNLLRFALKGCRPGKYHVQAFANWSNRYGDPTHDIIKEV